MTYTISENAPVFIGGIERTGKTYMRMMLAAHSHFAISRRTNMWTRYHGRFGALSDPTNLERCLGAMLKRKHIRALVDDEEQLCTDFAGGPQTYGQLFGLIHEQYAQRLAKPRWGDQTELLERHVDRILTAYPNARFIHMIRDPRDRFEALVDRRPKDRARLGQATAKWRLSIALAHQNLNRFPNNYRVVQYESMVKNPEETMRAVCRFLQADYEPHIIYMSHEPRFGHLSGKESPLSPDFIGRFQKGLDAKEIAFIQSVTGLEMKRNGYSLAEIGTPLSANRSDAARFWIKNGVQLVGWHILTMLRSRFPYLGWIKARARRAQTQLVKKAAG